MSHSSDRGAYRYSAVLGAEGVGLGSWHANHHQWLGSRDFTCDAAQPAWEAAVDTLATLLAEHAVRGAQLRVLLSARYSRFCLVPWSDAISHPRELDAYARACFENLYGQPLETLSGRIGIDLATGEIVNYNATQMKPGQEVRA